LPRAYRHAHGRLTYHLMAALGAAEVVRAAAFSAGARALTVDSRGGRSWMLCATSVNSSVGGVRPPAMCCDGSCRRRQHRRPTGSRCKPQSHGCCCSALGDAKGLLRDLSMQPAPGANSVRAYHSQLDSGMHSIMRSAAIFCLRQSPKRAQGVRSWSSKEAPALVDHGIDGP